MKSQDGVHRVRRRPLIDWNQELDLSLGVDGSVDLGNLGLKRSGSRAVARSGTLEWVDPFVGLRVRHQLSPGSELQFLGDVGGFGVGSDFTWQLFGGYSFDFAIWQTRSTGSWAIAHWLWTTPKTVQTRITSI